MVYKAESDGYTWISAPPPPFVINPGLYPKLGYDPLQFVPVTVMAAVPNVLLVNPKVPANTVQEFIRMAQAKPGEFSYGSVGAGTPGHLSAVALALGSKLTMTHVPYKGVGPLMNDLMAGRLQVFFSSASAAMGQIKGGKLKALAVTTPQRMASLPNVPTVAESGLPGFSYSLWGGLFAPAGTPQSVIDLLNREVNTIMNSPDIRARFEADGLAVPRNSPAEFAQILRSDLRLWTKVIKDAGIKN
jgi:tripartite-type tricarboxylate transporter receptor subunit TctC